MLNPLIDPTTHYNKNNFWQIIEHEMAHIYYNHSISSGRPYWLNEGLAMYFAKQKPKSIKYKKQILKAFKYFDTFDSDIYYYGGNMVNFMISKIGIKNVIKIIKLFSKTTQTKEDFGKIFKKYISIQRFNKTILISKENQKNVN